MATTFTTSTPLMRVAVMTAPGAVHVGDRSQPVIVEPTDAIIRLAATCVCGSDLWPYRGVEPVDQPRPMGHEYVVVFDLSLPLEQVADGYRAMDERRAIKTLLRL